MKVEIHDHRSLTPKSYLPTLDGWRAIAILGVMIAHAANSVFCPEGSLPNAWWYAVIRRGGLGVDIFFGISGFLICSRLLQEHRQNGQIGLRSFYIRRIFRILPASFAYLAVVGLLTLAGFSLTTPIMWWSCVGFFRNYLPLPGPDGHYTGHFWSLAVEEHFYLLWPSLLFLCGPRRARPWALGLALAVAAWRVWEFRHQWLGHWIPGAAFYVRTDIRLDGLLWGCWAALVLEVSAWRGHLGGPGGHLHRLCPLQTTVGHDVAGYFNSLHFAGNGPSPPGARRSVPRNAAHALAGSSFLQSLLMEFAVLPVGDLSPTLAAGDFPAIALEHPSGVRLRFAKLLPG